MNERFTHDGVVTRFRQVHGDLYDYPDPYVGSEIKIVIFCKTCNASFKQIPANHLQGQGCPTCALRKLAAKAAERRMTTKECVRRSVKAHGGYLYGYDRTAYVNQQTKIIIYCKTCNKYFEQLPQHHYNGQSCWDCGVKKRQQSQMLSFDEYVRQCRIKHGNTYNYDQKSFSTVQNKLMITCLNCLSEFRQRGTSHLNNGSGCPQCAASKHVSAGEIEWLDFLGIPNNKRNVWLHIKNRRLNVDGLIGNTVYEYYGTYYHGDLRIKDASLVNHKNGLTMLELNQKTIKREALLRSAGYTLITIWENDWLSSTAPKRSARYQRWFSAA